MYIDLFLIQMIQVFQNTLISNRREKVIFPHPLNFSGGNTASLL